MLDVSSILNALILLPLVCCGAACLTETVLAWIFSQWLVFLLVLHVSLSLSLLSSEILYLSPPDLPARLALGICFTFVLCTPAAVFVPSSHDGLPSVGLPLPDPMGAFVSPYLQHKRYKHWRWSFPTFQLINSWYSASQEPGTS